ncbi:ABC transporter substrate-binding protein [Sutterella sp.]|uniref:ABC transporter substrate-binding protein n=1 Tax=Sutterella sp. TaxID=1981025 RepID=UPI0026E07A13|nr:NrtA/SsuA/CpmA family ABC transporter substrate-binding protein [Sutterella sp.]MDO5531111.1 NrtA/SsuA/CpmA family ABC transporter substrate-binding protein [Sutterella sp.]
MKLRTLLATVAVTASAILSTAVSAAMPEQISITYVKSPFNLQNIVMKERGMLEEAFKADGVKINWRVINSGAVQGQAMASGDLDFSAVMNTASVLMAAGAGNPIAIATGVGHPKEIFAIIGKPGANYTVKDLKGKKVVGPKGTVLHQLLVAALLKEGMKISDVDFISMDPAAAMTAVVSGNADAGLVAAGLIIKANASGANTIATCEGYVSPNLVMTVRRAFVEQYPEAFEKVVATNRAALAWIRANKAEALAMGAKEQGISIENAEKLFNWSGFYDTLTEADVKGLEADQQFLLENGMMEKKIDVRSLLLPSATK